jgi:hypothetical protein
MRLACDPPVFTFLLHTIQGIVISDNCHLLLPVGWLSLSYTTSICSEQSGLLEEMCLCQWQESNVQRLLSVRPVRIQTVMTAVPYVGLNGVDTDSRHIGMAVSAALSAVTRSSLSAVVMPVVRYNNVSVLKSFYCSANLFHVTRCEI